MKILLRRYENQGGQQIAIERAFEADRLTIGRGTGAGLLLADMRIALEHAELRMQERGAYLLETRDRQTAWVAGAPTAMAALGPGESFELGRFRLTIGTPPPGTDLLLEVEERYSAREEKARRESAHVLTLAQGGWRKRRPALLLTGAILLIGLLLPPLLREFPLTATAASLDRIWQAGPASSAHVHFMQDCKTCHVQPFQRAQNEACLACHKEHPNHSDDPAILALPEFTDARCGSCHLEHSGEALIARRAGLCTDCHADPRERFAAAHNLQAAERFSDAHPVFSLSLPRWRDGRLVRAEVEQTGLSGLNEESNLRFPHDLHLNPGGVNVPDGAAPGVPRGFPSVTSAGGLVAASASPAKRVLDCGSCHVPAGRGFAPVTMAAQCMDCHRLDFDPDETERLVPHAQPAQVAKTIRDHYARQALAGQVPAGESQAPEFVRRPRAADEEMLPEQARAALAWAESRATAVIDEVFERRLCGQCHVVERTGKPDLPWDVRPVALTANFLRGARFDHAAHRTQSCANCHEAATSGASTDVLIPDLASCQQCHGDADAAAGHVPSACVDCHGFHIARETMFGGSSP